MKKANHYINNKQLQEEMLLYNQKVIENRNNLKPEPPASTYIGQSILFIANRYASKHKFFGYTNLWKEEMIADGIEDCIKYGLKNYDPLKFSNPFAYFTEIIHWAFVRRIKREKLEQYKKLKNQQSNELIVQLSSNSYKNTENEIADNLIKDFERKIGEEKKKRSNVKKGVELFSEEE